MSKFNSATIRPAANSPITTERTASTVTAEGGPGFLRDSKSELFLLAVTNMVSEGTFYERAKDRDDRYSTLVRTVGGEDPEWTTAFLRWLRSDANMRSASIVGAAEFAYAALADGVPGTRAAVSSVLQRADEPGEMLAYWMSTHGRAIPKPIKRGVADAAVKLYDERAFVKWDSDARGFRFGDVIDLTHPTPKAPWQGDLFRHAMDRRHGRDTEIPESLQVLRARAELMRMSVTERRALVRIAAEAPDSYGAGQLKAASMTWESLAGWLQGPMDKAAWEAVIPSMGYMALLRNLRNFDEAGVSDEVAERVAARLADPDQVARSRQFPMRFLSAYRAAPSLRWAHPLEKALNLSLGNVPALAGRTLILVDTSTSMDAPFSWDGTLMRWDAAVVFGLALAARCSAAEVVSFSSTARFWGDPHNAHTRVFSTHPGESVLRGIERWRSGGYFLGGGTATEAALRQHFAAHDRVVILTDEQAGSDGRAVGGCLPANTPLYTWNLAGHRVGHGPSGFGTRHTFGGLTDQGFQMIPLLEAGRNGHYPWMSA